MARPFSGDAQAIEHAQLAVAQATTAEQLRQAQAVLLPLLYGLSLSQT
ncbi:MAG: winged helix-turn-helix domain-containing protein, partial [Brachymonas sp.]|nr:winged helix-turn-helix domain-containing protein [Brachymonas sp.]